MIFVVGGTMLHARGGCQPLGGTLGFLRKQLQDHGQGSVTQQGLLLWLLLSLTLGYHLDSLKKKSEVCSSPDATHASQHSGGTAHRHTISNTLL